MKVYVVEVGAYSDRYVDILFTTRELAEEWIERRRRFTFERQKAQHDQMWAQFPPDVQPSLMSRYPRGFPEYDAWVKLNDGWTNDFGYVDEYEVFDNLPVADAVS